MNKVLLGFCIVWCVATGVHATPGTMNFQGKIEVNGAPFTGTGLFRFAIVNVDGSQTFWSNDGLDQPEEDISLDVDNGLYQVLLGQDLIMDQISQSVFDNEPLFLRIWFSDGVNGLQLMAPDQAIGSAGFAFKAADADALSGKNPDQFMYNDQDNTLDGGLVMTGNLGIGTDTPSQPLTVIGRIRAASDETETNCLDAGHNGEDGYVKWVGAGDLELRYSGVPKASLTQTGDFSVTGTVEGRDMAVDGAKLDGIAASAADTTDDSWSGVTDIAMTTGKVGIGTTTPDTKLSVIGSVRSASGASEAAYLEMSHGGVNGILNWTGAGGLNFRYDGTSLGTLTQSGDFSVSGTVEGRNMVADGAKLDGIAAGAEDSTNDSWTGDTDITATTGRIGVGTSSPLSILDVQDEETDVTGTSGVFLSLRNTNNDNGAFSGVRFKNHSTDGDSLYKAGVFFQRTDTYGRGKLYLATNDIPDTTNADILDAGLTVTSSGQVGIGNTDPQCRLDVSGNTHVDGYLKVGDPETPAAMDGHSNFIFRDDFHRLAAFEDKICGSGDWSISSSDDYYLRWDQNSNSERSYVYGVWVWIPPIYDFISFSLKHDAGGFENGHDGVTFQISSDGRTFTDIAQSDWIQNPPNQLIYPMNESCDATEPHYGWDDNDLTGDAVSSTEFFNARGWVTFRWIAGSDETNNGDGWYQCDYVDVYSYFSHNPAGFQDGGIYAEGPIFAHSSVYVGDLVEYLPVNDRSTPGDLISIDPISVDAYAVSSRPYDPNLAGVHSENPSVAINNPNSGAPVALAGRVKVKVANAGGSIKTGDFITSSGIPGLGMKADRTCYAVGRALEPLKGSAGEILVLVQPGWYNPVNQDHITLMGSHSIHSNRTEELIYNDSVTCDSKIFVSFRGDPGCRWWIDDIASGAFKLKFSDHPADNTPFDYMIKTDALAGSIRAVNPSPELSETANSGNGKLMMLENPATGELIPSTQLLQRPPTPPDPSRVWVFDAREMITARQYMELE